MYIICNSNFLLQVFFFYTVSHQIVKTDYLELSVVILLPLYFVNSKLTISRGLLWGKNKLGTLQDASSFGLS